MSSEELKIRGELEMDIESDLEQEIKDGIYHLALRLHRLYQHQKERNYARNHSENLESKSNKILSEVNINIRLEGGTKIEIKETKKEIPEQKIRPQSAKSENSQAISNMIVYGTNKKKYDWAKSSRSSGSDFVSPVINRRNEKKSSQKIKAELTYDNDSLENVRKNLSSGAWQRKGSLNVDNIKVLEMGWKW